MYLGFELENYKPLERVSQKEVDEYKARARNLNIQDLAELVVTRLQRTRGYSISSEAGSHFSLSFP